jgi:DNA replication initiation complex subunit (GINS family)
MVTNEEERAAVNAFLAQEREFLQSLASLVQGHAESVKGMARRARSVPPAPSAVPIQAPAPRTEPAEAPSPEAAEPPSPIAQGPRPTPAPAEAEAEATQALPKPEEPIRVDEPERTGAARPDEGDPSLRDLFWGEED